MITDFPRKTNSVWGSPSHHPLSISMFAWRYSDRELFPRWSGDLTSELRFPAKDLGSTQKWLSNGGVANKNCS